MSFSDVWGQPSAISALTRAIERREVHHAYLFEGPDGVGKERTALRVARALLCEKGGCMKCSACSRSTTLSPETPEVPLHPDVVLIARGIYPAAAIGRSRPESTEISVDQIRSLVLAKAAFGPHEGRARITVIRNAEELSISAANALLKTLEEPRDKQHFILLSSKPDRLLPTIRSRTLRVRFGALDSTILARVAAAHGHDAQASRMAIDLSGGSAAAMLRMTHDETLAGYGQFVNQMTSVLNAKHLGTVVDWAESAGSSRDDLLEKLRALAAHLGQAARSSVDSDPAAAARQARRYSEVLRACFDLERNASAPLRLVEMVQEMRAVR